MGIGGNDHDNKLVENRKKETKDGLNKFVYQYFLIFQMGFRK